MENNNNNQQSFWQFSDQLRVQTPNLANLSLNDSIWSTNSVFKERRNLDIAADKNNQIDYYFNQNQKKTSDNINSNWNWKSSSGSNPNTDMGFGLGFGPVGSKSTVDLNPIDKFNTPFNDTWKFNSVNVNNVNGFSSSNAVNGDFNKGVYSSMKKYGYNVNLKQGNNNNNNKNKGINEDHQIQKNGKKNRKNHQNNNQRNEDDKNGLDKRFKTLPPAEALPRNETIGGYIFVCNNDTMEENLKRQLFGIHLLCFD